MQEPTCRCSERWTSNSVFGGHRLHKPYALTSHESILHVHLKAFPLLLAASIYTAMAMDDTIRHTVHLTVIAQRHCCATLPLCASLSLTLCVMEYSIINSGFIRVMGKVEPSRLHVTDLFSSGKWTCACVLFLVQHSVTGSQNIRTNVFKNNKN